MAPPALCCLPTQGWTFACKIKIFDPLSKLGSREALFLVLWCLFTREHGVFMTWALPCSLSGLGGRVHKEVSLRLSREALGRRGDGQPLWIRGTASPLDPTALHPPPCPQEALAYGWSLGEVRGGSAGQPVTLGVGVGYTMPLPLKFLSKKKETKL